MPFTQVKDAKIYYEDHGKGLPIVFVHGWTSSSWKWFNQVEYFKKNYRVITLDLKGHGNSEKPHSAYLVSDFVKELDQFVSQILGEERFVLVGMSMGGMIVLSYAIQFSSKLIALVPCSTSFTMENPVLSRMVEQLKQGSLKFDRSLREMLIKLGHSGEFARKNKELLRKELEGSSQCPDYVAIACMDAFVNKFNIEKDLPSIQVPTLLLAGEKDEMIDPKQSEKMVSLIPHASLQLMGPKVGHCIQLERPDEFNRILEAFIESRLLACK